MGETILETRLRDFNTLRGMLSHDMNNVLTPVQGNLTLYCMQTKEKLCGEIEGYFGSIKKSVQKMSGKNFPGKAIHERDGIEGLKEIVFYEHTLRRESGKILQEVEKIRDATKNLQDTKYKEEFNSGLNRIQSVAEMVSMGSMSRETIENTCSYFNPAEIAEGILDFHARYSLGKIGSGIVFHYEDIGEICSNRGALLGTINGLVTNSGEHIIPGEVITVGLRQSAPEELEIIVEQPKGKKKREIFGEGNGKGLNFVRDSVAKLEGAAPIQKDSAQLDPELYSDSKFFHFGEVREIDIEAEYPIYSTKITIPISLSN